MSQFQIEKAAGITDDIAAWMVQHGEHPAQREKGWGAVKTQDKIQRMLLAFEAGLPEHIIGKWVFAVQPHSYIVIDESEVKRIGDQNLTSGLLTGRGECLKCRQQFDNEPWGNYCVYPEQEQERLAIEYPTLTTAYKIDEMKKLIQSKAEKSGKCWCDVPKLPKTVDPANE